MTDLDTDRPHVVLAPHLIPHSGTWWAACTCGAEFMGTTAEEVREAARPHRDVSRERAGVVHDRERDEARRLRREARREQRRSKGVHSGGKGRGVR